MAQIDIILDDPRWVEAQLQTLAQLACDATFAELSLDGAFEVCLLGCDDIRIAALNAKFRDKPASTNVLSWPSEDRAADEPGGSPHLPNTLDPELGDIAISYDTCVREAAEQSKRFTDHVSHLLVHGTMHLLGYDHETNKDAALMEPLETRILAKLGIEDPY